MKKLIDIQEVTTLPVQGSPVGWYAQAGMLYAVGYPGGAPTYVGMAKDLAEDTSEPGTGGISEGALLRAIAISQRPELAKELL